MTDPAQVRMDDLAAQRAEARAARHAAERAHAATINWTLINDLATKPHPLLNIEDDLEAQLRAIPASWTGEVFQEARTAHHLLDMAGIPRGKGYSSNVDARTYLAITELGELRERLARIAGWHARETGPVGTVGDYCTECGARWPCDTRRMAEGSYDDEEAEKTYG